MDTDGMSFKGDLLVVEVAKKALERGYVTIDDRFDCAER